MPRITGHRPVLLVVFVLHPSWLPGACKGWMTEERGGIYLVVVLGALTLLGVGDEAAGNSLEDSGLSRAWLTVSSCLESLLGGVWTLSAPLPSPPTVLGP